MPHPRACCPTHTFCLFVFALRSSLYPLASPSAPRCRFLVSGLAADILSLLTHSPAGPHPCSTTRVRLCSIPFLHSINRSFASTYSHLSHSFAMSDSTASQRLGSVQNHLQMAVCAAEEPRVKTYCLLVLFKSPCQLLDTAVSSYSCCSSDTLALCSPWPRREKRPASTSVS